MVSGVLMIPYSRLPMPYPFAKISEPFLTMPIVQPGLVVLLHGWNKLSIFFIVAAGNGCADTAEYDSAKKSNRTLKVFPGILIG